MTQQCSYCKVKRGFPTGLAAGMYLCAECAKPHAEIDRQYRLLEERVATSTRRQVRGD